MKSLKDYIMGNEKKKHLAERKVTTISYDLDTTKDNNINQEIKDYLIAKGWNYIVPEQQVVRYVGKTTVEKNVDTPNTTAWKADMNPIDAINEFSAAILAFNELSVVISYKSAVALKNFVAISFFAAFCVP